MSSAAGPAGWPPIALVPGRSPACCWFSGDRWGDCTFTGCVPSKALIEAAHRREPFDRAIAAARAAVEVVAATETDDVLRRQGVEVLHG